MSRFHATLACGAMLAMATPAAADDLCARALTALGSGGAALACTQTPAGVAIAPDAERAARLSQLSEAGEGRFKAYFGRDAPRYVVMEAVELDGVSDPKSVLQEAGFSRVLIWFSQEEQINQVVAAARTSAEAAARRQGLDEAAVTAAGERAATARRPTQVTLDTREAQVVPHELGHGWFVKAFWPDHQSVAQGHYGGPGPDWLDEISALLMEDDNGAEERRKVFRDVYQGRAGAHLSAFPVADLIDLPRFLSRDHPAQTRPEIRPAASSVSGGVTMRVIDSSDPNAMAQVLEAALYYPQGRMFADFLLDRTGDPEVFKSIAEALAQGTSFEDWLSAQGPSRRLPGTIADLDGAWREWLVVRLGEPSSERS